MPDIKILGVGSPMLDLLINVDDAFIGTIEGEKGGMELVAPELLESILAKSGAEAVSAPGGSAANTIFGLAHLGMKTALLGKTGDDEQAKFYLEQYSAMGGDTSSLKVNPVVPTGRCLSMITPDSERTMRTDLGAAMTLSVEDVTAEDFAGISHVHVEGYMLFNTELTFHILKLAKAAACIISLDMASFEVVNASKNILSDLLKDYVDIIFANEEEAAAFCGSNDPEAALAEFAKCADTVAVKVGKDGAYILHHDEKVKIDAEIVTAIDTTGAGDLWASGFLYGFLNGKSLAESGAIGAKTGAAVVQVMGAAIPDATWQKIKSEI